MICCELQQIFSQVDFRDCAIPNIFVVCRIAVERLANFDHEDGMEAQNEITVAFHASDQASCKKSPQRTRRGTQSLTRCERADL